VAPPAITPNSAKRATGCIRLPHQDCHMSKKYCQLFIVLPVLSSANSLILNLCIHPYLATLHSCLIPICWTVRPSVRPSSGGGQPGSEYLLTFSLHSRREREQERERERERETERQRERERERETFTAAAERNFLFAFFCSIHG
jgi:hypothetical protein